jgi:hypothetical protein
MQEALFVREADAKREHWNGHDLTRAETTARSGVKTVNFVTDFEPFTTALFDRRVYGARRLEASSETRHERHREAT